MLYGHLPFFGNNDSELFKDITQSKADIFKKNEAISAKTKNLIKRCLTVDINKRIGWGELFAECKLLSSNGFRQGR
jgi:serine/threonine protein kinase